jgi:hypothetical protein
MKHNNITDSVDFFYLDQTSAIISFMYLKRNCNLWQGEKQNGYSHIYKIIQNILKIRNCMIDLWETRHMEIMH